jgi:hypothetical protein
VRDLVQQPMCPQQSELAGHDAERRRCSWAETGSAPNGRDRRSCRHLRGR